MFRLTHLALLAALTLSSALGQSGRPDYAFNHVPFHEWLKHNDQTHLHWSADVAPVTLSPHQRLASRIRFEIDGAEVAKRVGKGQLMMFVEIEDEQKRLWQDHEVLNLEQPDFKMQGSNLQFLDDFFVCPGSYRASFALYYTATGEHSVIRRSFHASPLHGDPFPASWNNLPAIEYLRIPPAPDGWYLPTIRSRPAVTVEAPPRTTVDLLLNLTPSEQISGSLSAQNRSLSVLLPSLKVLAQLDWRNSQINVSLLDLARQRIPYEQDAMRRLNWRLLSASLGGVVPGMIDVQALSGQKRQADFFVAAIQKKIEASSGSHALIILSSPVGFEHGQEMHPIEASPRPGLRTYYIRYLPRLPYSLSELKRMDITQRPPRREVASLIDQLEPLLKPISPHLFDVATPEEFRRAVAAIAADMAVKP